MLIKHNIVALLAFLLWRVQLPQSFLLALVLYIMNHLIADIMIMFTQYRLSVTKVNHFILGKQR